MKKNFIHYLRLKTFFCLHMIDQVGKKQCACINHIWLEKKASLFNSHLYEGEGVSYDQFN
jgi:hypothetical protein